jgi:PKHD-type hydroxylase
MFIPALPVRNPTFSVVRGQHIFSDSECDQIRQSVDRQAWQEGKIVGPDDSAVMTEARSVLEQPVPVDPSGFPLVRVINEICRLNSGLWYFDLTGFVPDDPPMVMTYRDNTGDHYDWHIDVGEGKTASRKLSFTVQLSASAEYEGGDLELRAVSADRATFRRKGMMLVFPTFMLHRVTPITKGTRQVIVGWVHGPSFR